MNYTAACQAIEAILAAISDDDLPKFDRIEFEGDRVVVWYGGVGRHLGSARTRRNRKSDERDPLVYRRDAAREAIQLEMVYRADRRFLDQGDDASDQGKVRKLVLG